MLDVAGYDAAIAQVTYGHRLDALHDVRKVGDVRGDLAAVTGERGNDALQVVEEPFPSGIFLGFAVGHTGEIAAHHLGVRMPRLAGEAFALLSGLLDGAEHHSGGKW